MPVLAAVGGMIVPALIFSGLVMAFDDPAALAGWAVPTATDIAFALAVLAVFGRGLPRALRTFLLTLAVVDDLLAIIVIAVFYTETIDFLMMIGRWFVSASDITAPCGTHGSTCTLFATGPRSAGSTSVPSVISTRTGSSPSASAASR